MFLFIQRKTAHTALLSSATTNCYHDSSNKYQFIFPTADTICWCVELFTKDRFITHLKCRTLFALSIMFYFIEFLEYLVIICLLVHQLGANKSFVFLNLFFFLINFHSQLKCGKLGHYQPDTSNCGIEYLSGHKTIHV